MQLYQIRVLDERTDLAHRLGNLKTFFGSTIFRELGADEKDLLIQQSVAMETYLSILNRRIALFQE